MIQHFDMSTMSSALPSYSQATSDDSLLQKIERIVDIRNNLSAMDFQEIGLSEDACLLLGFLTEVLKADYSTCRATAPIVGPRTHIKWTKCAIQLRYDAIDEASRLLDGDQTPRGSRQIADLQKLVYKPAEELDILTEPIKEIYSRYLKYTSEDGIYYGSIAGILQESGVDGLQEKLAWDYFYFSVTLGTNTRRRVPLLVGQIRASRKYLPRECLVAQWIEYATEDSAMDDPDMRIVEELEGSY